MRQPLGPISVNLRPIITVHELVPDDTCELNAESSAEKKNGGEKEEDLSSMTKAESAYDTRLPTACSGNGDGSAADNEASSLKGLRASKSQKEQLWTLTRNKDSGPAPLMKQLLSQTKDLTLKCTTDSVLTANDVSLSTNKESSISAVPPASSSSSKDENAVNARGHKSRRQRSPAPDKVVTHKKSAKTAGLNKDITAHLEPLVTLEGVTSEIKNIENWYKEWTLHCNVTKIAEGSFGSVFKLSDKEGLHDATIGKLMPLRPKSGKGSRKPGYTQVTDAASEIRLLETMSLVPGFVEFRSAEVLIGALPKPLKQAYRTYKANCKSNKSSICETLYPENQMWVFIEMGDAGTELEDALLLDSGGNGILERNKNGHGMISVQDIRDIFWGVTEALANGEEAHQFEHRDLHFSNICVQRKLDKVDTGYLLIPSTANIEVTLIDYTLSRASLPNGSAVWNSMTDEDIFSGEDDLQFDVYRWMRDEIPGENPQGKKWESFVPKTNVLWLYHLLEKLMQQTTRPDEIGDERSLWEALNKLRVQLNPNIKRSTRFFSAMDVADYARDATYSVVDPISLEYNSYQDNRNNTQGDETRQENDLVARFACVKI